MGADPHREGSRMSTTELARAKAEAYRACAAAAEQRAAAYEIQAHHRGPYCAAMDALADWCEAQAKAAEEGT